MFDLAAAPNSGGVDQSEDRAAGGFDGRVDRIARRAGQLAGDEPLFTEEAIDQARFADVLPPDDGQSDPPRGVCVFANLGR